jgi:hypothetical protein
VFFCFGSLFSFLMFLLLTFTPTVLALNASHFHS